MVDTSMHDCDNCGEMVIGSEAVELVNPDNNARSQICGHCFLTHILTVDD